MLVNIRTRTSIIIFNRTEIKLGLTLACIYLWFMNRLGFVQGIKTDYRAFAIPERVLRSLSVGQNTEGPFPFLWSNFSFVRTGLIFFFELALSVTLLTIQKDTKLNMMIRSWIWCRVHLVVLIKMDLRTESGPHLLSLFIWMFGHGPRMVVFTDSTN